MKGKWLGGQAFLIVVIGVGDDGFFFFFGADFTDFTDFGLDRITGKEYTGILG